MIERLAEALADRYRIVRPLGKGGTATVYLADDLRHDRQVAIKVLSPEIGATIGHERFLREIEIVAGLRHPLVLPLYDSGEAAGLLFYVMPHAVGDSLRDRLDREGQLPIDEAVAIASDVAEALAFAHARGLIHRDVKPENILLESGHAVVADFGIARAIGAAGDDRLTTTGHSIGTPQYMSPEQAAGSEGLDGRSDLYSLACVLYEMLAGDPPFVARTPGAVAARHVAEPPPSVRTVRGTVPPALDRAIHRAMAKTPVDRFVDAEAFRAAIRQAAAGDVPAEGSRARAGGRRLLLPSALAAAALVAAALGLLSREEAPPADPDRVMVFPLVTAAASEGRGVGEDMAAVVGNAVDGVGSLRWIDGWSVLPAEARGDIRELGMDEAEALARGQRAWWFVTGRVIPRGDSTEVALSLHEVGGDVSAARASAVAPEPWRAALRALNGLLPTIIPGGTPDVPGQWEDRVPGAVASFLLGEASFRRLRTVEALGHYRQAVELDPGFALAALRGAQVASWQHRPEEAGALALAASREPLPPRYAAFARGLRFYLEGRADSATAHLRNAVAEDPEMGAAWLQLGETYTHLLARSGDPGPPAEAAFEEAHRLDPAATTPLFHLAEIRLRKGDAEGAGRLIARLREGAPDDTSSIQKLAIMLDCVERGPAAMPWDDIAATRAFPLLSAARAFGESNLPCTTAAAEGVLRADTATTPEADGRRFFAQMILFAARLGQGRISEAAEGLDAYVSRWGSGTSLYLLAAPVYEGLVDRTRDVALGDRSRFGADYRGMPYNTRLWAAGVFEARHGDVAVAASVRDEMRRRAEASGEDRDRVMARSLEAQVALARGDTSAALRLLDALVPAAAASDDVSWSEALPLGLERLTLARLLLSRGSVKEALDVATVFDSPWPVIYSLYRVPSLELRAEAAARLGEGGEESRLRARLGALARPAPR